MAVAPSLSVSNQRCGHGTFKFVETSQMSQERKICMPPTSFNRNSSHTKTSLRRSEPATVSQAAMGNKKKFYLDQ